MLAQGHRRRSLRCQAWTTPTTRAAYNRASVAKVPTVSVPVRLAKRVIELTGCSRRESAQYIEGGWVLVDGEVVDEPQFQVLGHKVELAAGAKLGPVEPATILLHKPAGFDADG